MLESDGNTQNGPIVKYNGEEKYDVFIRAYGSSIEDMQIIYFESTSSVEYQFKSYLKILFEIIKSQRKQLEFNSYYIAFLLGQISQEELEKISRKFVIKRKKVPTELLKNKVEMLQALTNHDLTPKEMAQYFFCEEKDIIRALKLLHS